MASPRAIARALARGAEKEAVKPRAPKPLTAEEIAAARHVFRAGDDAGLGRNYVRGVMKFTADGMTPEAKAARAREMEGDPSTWLYHGTPNDFPAFEPRVTPGWEQDGLGVSLDRSPNIAGAYAKGRAPYPPVEGVSVGANIIPVVSRAKVTPLADWEKAGRGEVEAVGRPVASMGPGHLTGEVRVFDASKLRSPFATFDPARANRRDLLAGVVPVAAAGGAAALAGAPQDAQAAEPSALARALAREAPRFNAALDTSLDVASFLDPTMGYATETARALKDLPGKVGPAGAVALAPLTGATEALGSIGQLPELGVAGGRALARAIARKPQPRGSQTYRKAK